jgi:hypothetical protein
MNERVCFTSVSASSNVIGFAHSLPATRIMAQKSYAVARSDHAADGIASLRIAGMDFQPQAGFVGREHDAIDSPQAGHVGLPKFSAPHIHLARPFKQ